LPVSFDGLNFKAIKRVKLIYSDGTYCVKRLIVCKSFFSRLKGMLFERKENHKKAYLIVPCNAIHTFFMAYPIDVVFLARAGDVISQSRVSVFRAMKERDAFAVLEGTRLLKSYNNVVEVQFLC